MKKVAVIGAGIFGVTASIELAKKFRVALFDKEKDIFAGATYVNHYRHHIGYHYPRSPETVEECRRAKQDFEFVYGNSLIPPFSSYYAISKKGSFISADEFINFCKKEQLPFEVSYPEKKYLDPKKVDLCIKVPEAVYDFKTLKNIAENLLKKTKNLGIKLQSLVTGGEIQGRDTKRLFITRGKTMEHEDFDYVINATYANYNLLCKAFGIEKKEIQFELVEHVVLEIANENKIGLTIMDGLFPSILPRGLTNYFTLGHVENSIHRRDVIDEGEKIITKKWGKIRSKKIKIIKESLNYFPFLKNADYVESLYVTRVVEPHRDFDDARLTEIKNHGSGFYSIFGGKIITCVTTAKQLKKIIEDS